MTAMKKIFHFVKPYRVTISIVLLMNVCATVITSVQPMFGKFIIDEVFLEKKFSFPLALGIAVLMLALAYGISLLTRFIYLRMSLAMMTDVRTAFYQHVLALPYSFFSQKRVGDLVARVNEDLSEVQRLYTDSVLQFISMGLGFVLYLTLLFLLDWKMALVCLFLLPVLVLGTHRFRDSLFEQNMELRKLAVHNQSFLVDSFSSVRYIRAANLGSWLEAKYRGELHKQNKQTIKVAFVSAFAQGVPQGVLIISTIGTVAFLGFKVLDGVMTVGSLIAFTAYQASLYASIQGFAQLYIRFQKGKVAVQRVGEFFELPAESKGWRVMPPFRWHIQFNQVCFSHAGSAPILKNLHVSIAKGEKIGIVGESGCGKSTLADLLARLYKPTSGIISIDGQDIQQINRDSWNERVCLVTHDDPIWFGSIADCLQLGKERVSEQQMQAILQEVGLWKDVEKMPDALHAQVGEKGLNLSAGQRQRLLLARALLKRPEILILDEATCHLDAESEQQIFQLLQEKLQETTVIVITHRTESIGWVDHILHLADGSIKSYEPQREVGYL